MVKSLEIKLVEKSAAVAKHIETKYVKDLKDSYVQTNNGTCDQLNMHTPNETFTVQESLGEKIQEHARISGDNNTLRHKLNYSVRMRTTCATFL